MDETPSNTLACFRDIVAATQRIRGVPVSDALTGALLKTLATSKPGGMFLEIGTGTGMGTAWIVDGMNANARLVTVEKYEKMAAIAKRFLGHDPRITFEVMDADVFLTAQQEQSFDLIFADASAGKFHFLAETLRLLKVGGFYLIDHLLPLSSTSEDQEHLRKINQVITFLEQQEELSIVKMNWATGLLLATKREKTW
jgi:predicted O-methyltransferase YrrM